MSAAGAEAVLAGVELGGTKAIIVVGQGGTIVARDQVPTRDPAATLGDITDRLAALASAHGVAALGVASFGPIRVDAAAADHGVMLPTTKPGWTGADVLGRLAAQVAGPAMIHTDVTAAAMAEARWGAAKGCRDVAYVTIGTGIGFGFLVAGATVTGTMHPEAGHLRVRRLPGDGFAGICPFHGDCLEGLASGPAVAARAGVPGNELAPGSPHWLPVVDALAESFISIILTLSPERIVIGGGLGVGQPQLLPLIRAAVVAKLAGYHAAVDAANVADLIVPAALGNDAGPLGAICLAEMALQRAARAA